jgi:hypothetical protein
LIGGSELLLSWTRVSPSHHRANICKNQACDVWYVKEEKFDLSLDEQAMESEPNQATDTGGYEHSVDGMIGQVGHGDMVVLSCRRGPLVEHSLEQVPQAHMHHMSGTE